MIKNLHDLEEISDTNLILLYNAVKILNTAQNQLEWILRYAGSYDSMIATEASAEVLADLENEMKSRGL